MATYTIITTRKYEAALTHNYDYYANEGVTKQAYFQAEINRLVLFPMDIKMQSDKTVNLTASLDTVPEANEDKCKSEIEASIVANGGTIITGPPTAIVPPIPLMNEGKDDNPS